MSANPVGRPRKSNINAFLDKNKKPLILGIGLVGGYYAYKKGYLDNIIGQIGVGKASDVQITVTPNPVKPGSTLTITYNFTDANGNPVRVLGAYFGIFEDIQSGASQRSLIVNGKLGTFTSSGSKDIDTSTFRDGTWTLAVSDQPVTGTPNTPPNPDVGTAGGASFDISGDGS